MEGITTVKISDLTDLFNEISLLRSELKKLRESEEQAKAFSIQQTADRLDLHYCSVRRLIIKGRIKVIYLDKDRGKCIVPLWAINEFLQVKKNTNQ